MHYQRFKFQLISLGPDGWTPGLNPVPSPPPPAGHGHRYYTVTMGVVNTYAPPLNPALVGTDTDMTAPVVEPAMGHPEGTGDDITNLKG